MSTYSIAVLGAGNMGTAIAQIIANNGYQVNLWNYEGDAEPLAQIKDYHENKKYLPGVKLSENIFAKSDIIAAVRGAQVVFFVVPSFVMESVVQKSAPHLSPKTVCVDASKGIDEKSLGLITDIIAKNLPSSLRQYVTTISGPAIASDMAQGGFTAMNIASRSLYSLRLVKSILENENLKLFPSKDITGIEITGSFKNVYAIAMGICDGLGLSMNTKAALLVIALREIASLVKKMKGKMETVYDLAGLGDLVGTGLCAKSRNRRFGQLIAQGRGVTRALDEVGQVVEGIHASKVLHDLARKFSVTAPFAAMVHAVAVEQKEPKHALENFLKKL